RHIGVLDRPPGAPAVIGHLVEQIQASGVPVLRVLIGKQGADVTDAGGAAERVNQGVADDVGIAVALQSHVPGEFDATEHEPATDDQSMKVEAGPYTHKGSAASRASTISASSRVATLRLL